MSTNDTRDNQLPQLLGLFKDRALGENMAGTITEALARYEALKNVPDALVRQEALIALRF